MNKDNARYYLPLVQALAEGKVIQWKHRGIGWIDSNELSDAYPASDYRIKPEPREIWANHYPDNASGVMTWPTKEIAERQAAPGAITKRYREVIE